MKTYEKPTVIIENVASSLLCASETTSKYRCPKCGSTEYEKMEVPDKLKAGLGVGASFLSAFLTGNTGHAAHHAHQATQATKTIRICKKCGTRWE